MDVTCPNCSLRIQVTQRLTPSELRIAEQFAHLGVTRYTEIAMRTGLSYSTVKQGIAKVCRKLEMTPTELLCYWNCELFQEGLRA